MAGGEDCGRLGMDDARRGKARRTKRSGARHLAGCVSRLSSQRQKGKLDHPTHVAAVKAVLEARPDLSPEEASRQVQNAVCWAASEHTEWFWRGVGSSVKSG